MKEDEGEGVDERMKIVIGYDGSAHAGAALDDLRRAGLPRDAEALIVSVADVPSRMTASLWASLAALTSFIFLRLLD
jgi:hypothetical protein